jgi:hypothetical protein
MSAMALRMLRIHGRGVRCGASPRSGAMLADALAIPHHNGDDYSGSHQAAISSVTPRHEGLQKNPVLSGTLALRHTAGCQAG